jgi:peptidoglycan/xylan/chitin deacetylase (PgdA/CDA1 family)
MNGGTTVQAIYNGNRANPNVSLMFNVYENTKVVEGIAQELDKRGLKATFFVGGCWADDNGEMLNKLVASGHEIANHGYFHKDHKKLSYEQNKEEIRLTGAIVKALCGQTLNLFAPPSGSFSDDTLSAASNLGYKVIMWSKDTIDWRDKDVSLIVKRATQKTTNGDLILMHPKEHTLKALPTILDYFEKIGLKQVKVSQNISQSQTLGENNDVQ